MAATVTFYYYGASASEPAGASAEGGWKFNREDTQSGTTPIPIPTATGQNFSWHKNFAFNVSGTGTNLSNFTIKAASAYNVTGPPNLVGLRLWWAAKSTYTQSTSAHLTDSASSNSTAPTNDMSVTFAAVTTTAQQWYAGPIAAGAGRKGDFLYLALGVGYDYVQGGNSNFTLPNMTAAYDEA